MNVPNAKNSLSIIGSTEFVEVAGINNIPAKIDTGADSSSIWASSINIEKDDRLTFSLFAEGSPFYTGERLSVTDYKVRSVRSSHGDRQIRYRVTLPIKIGDQEFETNFTLANRSHNCFPVLIGRHTIEGKFLVDVTRMLAPRKKSTTSLRLNQELRKNPYEFHQKYVNNILEKTK